MWQWTYQDSDAKLAPVGSRPKPLRVFPTKVEMAVCPKLWHTRHHQHRKPRFRERQQRRPNSTGRKRLVDPKIARGARCMRKAMQNKASHVLVGAHGPRRARRKPGKTMSKLHTDVLKNACHRGAGLLPPQEQRRQHNIHQNKDSVTAPKTRLNQPGARDSMPKP